jgi:hypothetical protein
MNRGIFLIAAIFVMTVPAQAQADVRPVINDVIDVVALALMAGGGVLIAFVMAWIKSRTKMQDNEFEALLASRLNDILHRSIEHAVVVAKNEVAKPGSGLEAVKFDNWFLNIAAGLAMKQMPDIIEYFQLSKEGIEEMIISRLGGYVNEVEVGGAAATANRSAEAARSSSASNALVPAS